MKISELPKEDREKAMEYQRDNTNEYYSKKTDILTDAFKWNSTKEGYDYWNNLYQSDPPIESVFSKVEETNIKPKQYQIGIDTFERMEKNCTLEERLAFVRGNIDKYIWRKKGQDKQDFEKIINYAKWALKQLENGE